MKFKRGLFRIWLLITIALMIGLPIIRLNAALDGQNDTCFEIRGITFKVGTQLDVFEQAATRPPPPEDSDEANDIAALVDRGVLLDKICTGIANEGDALIKRWDNIESLTVEFDIMGKDPPVTLTGASFPRNYYDLVGRAITDFRGQITKEVGHEVPYIEAFTLGSMILLWWSGRLFVFIGAWIVRGFREP